MTDTNQLMKLLTDKPDRETSEVELVRNVRVANIRVTFGEWTAD